MNTRLCYHLPLGTEKGYRNTPLNREVIEITPDRTSKHPALGGMIFALQLSRPIMLRPALLLSNLTVCSLQQAVCFPASL
jgi:hypothetical protein